MVFKVNGYSHRPGCSDIQCPFPQAELILNGGKKVGVEYRCMVSNINMSMGD